jgi:serine/threonine protein kinase
VTETPLDALRPGDPQELGAYRLTARIGRGGMGTVYAAHGPNGEQVAIKVINPDLADDGSFRDRFRREVQSAQRVRAFCTAPVLAAQLDGEPLYIVTEFINGPNLDEFIRTSGPMRGSTLEHLSVGVATALSAIHGAGVIHRDLKPANVLLSPMGPRVIDFGIARALDNANQVTRTGQMIGTPSYMAPELIGGGQGSPASDVFAWGCVVAYAATGRVPFGGPTVPAIMHQIVQGTADLSGLADPELRGLVEAALEKDPAKRPTSGELLNQMVGRENADTATVAGTVEREWTKVLPNPTVQEQARTRVAGPEQQPTRLAPPMPGPPPRKPTGLARGRLGPLAKLPLWGLVAGAAAVLVLLVLGLVVLTSNSGGPPKANQIWKADFTDKQTWGDPGNGTLELKADKTSSESVKLSPFNGTPDRLLASVTVKQSGPQSGQFEVVCNALNQNNRNLGYWFNIRLDGDVLVSAVSGDPNVGIRQLYARENAPGFKKAGSNHVQIACEKEGKGTHLRLWLNGQLAADTHDPLGLPSGTVALGASQYAGGDDVVIDFTDFTIGQISG